MWKIKIPIQLIDLGNCNIHPVVHSYSEDGEELTWIIDTGASKSVFDQNKQHLIASTENAEEELHPVSIDAQPLATRPGILHPIYFGKLKIEKMEVALLDLNHINKLYAEACNMLINGLLGSDFLKTYRAAIDFNRLRLILRPPKRG